VVMASDGRYNVLLGSTTPEGLPLELFTAGEPRWLGVRFHRTGESEQPRVQLASVPYALKAADADTLGGKPASAYALAGPSVAARIAAAGGGAAATTRTGSANPTASTTNTAGSAGHIGVFVDPLNLGDSVMIQSGARVGLGTASPLDAFHVAFSDAF